MKPIDIENAIIRTLGDAQRRASLASTSFVGMTINQLHHSLAPAQGGGPIWRQVANAVYRLERTGLVHIAGDEQVGGNCQPLFALSAGGQVEAKRIASLAIGGLAPVQEVSHG